MHGTASSAEWNISDLGFRDWGLDLHSVFAHLVLDR